MNKKSRNNYLFAIYKGLSVALTRHFENMRVILSSFQNYMQNPNIQFQESLLIPYISIFSTNQKNNYVNLLNTKQAQEIGLFYLKNKLNLFFKEIMQRIYIKSSLRYLNDQFYEAINDDFTNIMTQKMALFICFNLIIFIIYFILWLPLIDKIVKDVKNLTLLQILYCYFRF